MRIRCPHCGERPGEEFVADGPAGLARPAPDAPAEAWHEYLHERVNPMGAHRELFYHARGCRAWLAVERDTRSHAVLGAEPVMAR
ncbi:sarcosine oxidase subunit delta [soil metagenome]